MRRFSHSASHYVYNMVYFMFPECENGTYGENCNKPCGHCNSDLPCNHIDGNCLTGCLPGYNYSKDGTCRTGMYYNQTTTKSLL